MSKERAKQMVDRQVRTL